MRALILAGLAVPFLTVPSLAVDQAFLREMWKERLGGWGGVAFSCDLQPKDTFNESLCEWTGQRLRSLLAPAKQRVLILANNDSFMQQFSITKEGDRRPIHLELKVMATASNNPVGVHATLVASNFHSKASEAGRAAPNPEAALRSGSLVLWDRSLIGTSPMRGSELQAGIRGALETNLMAFASDFIEAQR